MNVYLLLTSILAVFAAVLVKQYHSTPAVTPVPPKIQMDTGGKFALQIISDIHVEFPRVPEIIAEKIPTALEPHAPYLALLGDIGMPGTEKYRNLLLTAASKFKKVFVIAGNHEYYKGTYHDQKRRIQEVCNEKSDTLVFMDKTSILVDGVRILGTTLWSHVPNEHAVIISRSINDYNLIQVEEGDKFKKLTTAISNSWFEDERKWLHDEIEAAKGRGEKVIVLTHHAPSFKQTSAPEHDGSPNNGAFATNLEYMMGPPVVAWCFGHTHYSSDQIINGTRVVSNQVGYISFAEKSRFEPGKVIYV